MPFSFERPIGIFDSGMGGLSVLRHMYRQLPYAHFLYCADTDYAPYGDKSTELIMTRSLAITNFMMSQNIQALVVACNTATAAAVDRLRATYPHIPIVGIEPGLKPAASLTRNHIVNCIFPVQCVPAKSVESI